MRTPAIAMVALDDSNDVLHDIRRRIMHLQARTCGCGNPFARSGHLAATTMCPSSPPSCPLSLPRGASPGPPASRSSLELLRSVYGEGAGLPRTRRVLAGAGPCSTPDCGAPKGTREKATPQGGASR
jgi:hypothetical protein